MKEHFLTNFVNVLTDGKSHTVRIYGHGASGKTPLARDLLDLLPPDQVSLIETDAYIIDGLLRQQVRPAATLNQKVHPLAGAELMIWTTFPRRVV